MVGYVSSSCTIPIGSLTYGLKVQRKISRSLASVYFYYINVDFFSAGTECGGGMSRPHYRAGGAPDAKSRDCIWGRQWCAPQLHLEGSIFLIMARIDRQLHTLQLLSAHVKVLLDAPEHLWRLIECKKYLSAAWLFLFTRVVHRALVQQGDEDEDSWTKAGIDVMVWTFHILQVNATR